MASTAPTTPSSQSMPYLGRVEVEVEVAEVKVEEAELEEEVQVEVEETEGAEEVEEAEVVGGGASSVRRGAAHVAVGGLDRALRYIAEPTHETLVGLGLGLGLGLGSG